MFSNEIKLMNFLSAVLTVLRSERSLACHTYCDTGHPCIWSSLRTRDTPTYCDWQWRSHYLFLRLRSVVDLILRQLYDLGAKRNKEAKSTHQILALR